MDSSMIIYYDSYPLGIEQFALENHNWVNHRTKCTMASQSFLTTDRGIRIDIATGDDISKPITISLLLGGIPTPLKNMNSSMGRMTSHILWKIKKMKPPISLLYLDLLFFARALPIELSVEVRLLAQLAKRVKWLLKINKQNPKRKRGCQV